MEGIEKYKQELRNYAEWVNSLNVPVGMAAIEALDNGDWEKIQSWNSKLQGVEEALCLSAGDIKEIELECGIKQNSAQ